MKSFPSCKAGLSYRHELCQTWKFCVKFRAKTFCVFLKKTLAKSFRMPILAIVLRKWFHQDVKRLLGMNIKDRHHGKQNEHRTDAEHRNQNNDGKTNQKSHSMGASTWTIYLRGFIAPDGQSRKQKACHGCGLHPICSGIYGANSQNRQDRPRYDRTQR